MTKERAPESEVVLEDTEKSVRPLARREKSLAPATETTPRGEEADQDD